MTGARKVWRSLGFEVLENVLERDDWNVEGTSTNWDILWEFDNLIG